LEQIAEWPDPKYAGLFLRNTIAAAKFDSNRARPISEAWQRLHTDSPMEDLLLQPQLYKWPIPRDNSCFHPFCDHVVNELQSSHLQRAHDRKHILKADKDKRIKRVWNGESALQATTADLLNLWSVAEQGAKYCNPYAAQDEKKVSTFKSLPETWQTPEIREWHKHLGDFWGPVILHLKHAKEWMPIAMAFDTGYEHGFCAKENNEIIEHWRRGSCDVAPNSPIRTAFLPLLEQIHSAYTRADFDVQEGIHAHCDVSGLNIPQVTGPLLAADAGWEELSLEPGKSERKVVQWVNHFQGLIDRNKEEILTAIQTDDPHLQEKLEEMVDRMKNIWRVAKEDQKAAWNEVRRQSFGNSELATRLIDVICSFESRWIPHDHCACPICWESGLQQKFSNLPDFVNHMKNAHHIGWKNVKDYWCMIFTKALGKCVYRKITSGAPDHLDTEMGNAFAWSPYPKCKHTQDRSSSFIKHFEKEHKHTTVPAMGIWSLIVERIKGSADVNVGQFLNQRSGFACTKCGFFALSRRSVEDHCGMKHRAGDDARCVACQSSGREKVKEMIQL
jgi:hypothetical protein